MERINKNQIIILAVVLALILIFGGAIGWSLVQKVKLSPAENPAPEETLPKEVFNLSGRVSKIDAENNFLMVRPANQGSEVKVILSETTKLIKLEFPFDPKNPLKEGAFTPKQTEIEISDFKAGDDIFIKTKENIVGKSEFDDVDFIQILP